MVWILESTSCKKGEQTCLGEGTCLYEGTCLCEGSCLQALLGAKVGNGAKFISSHAQCKRKKPDLERNFEILHTFAELHGFHGLS